MIIGFGGKGSQAESRTAESRTGSGSASRCDAQNPELLRARSLTKVFGSRRSLCVPLWLAASQIDPLSSNGEPQRSLSAQRKIKKTTPEMRRSLHADFLALKFSAISALSAVKGFDRWCSDTMTGMLGTPHHDGCRAIFLPRSARQKSCRFAGSRTVDHIRIRCGLAVCSE